MRIVASARQPLSSALITLVLAAGCPAAEGPSTAPEAAPRGRTVSAPAPRNGAPEPAPMAGLTDAHNAVRATVGVDPVSWSPKLAATAQRWANHLRARGCDLEHSRSPYGENLFWMSSSADAQTVVDSWASERQDYRIKTNRCSGVCGHYTQVVWRETTSIGCGVARCSDGEVWVCNYDPPGNMNGRRPY